MALIQLELNNLKTDSATHSLVGTALEKFLADMEADKSGFFQLPLKSNWENELADVQPVLAKRLPEIDTFIHLGIGGSALGAETLVRGLGSPKAPTFHFLDNIDPDYISDIISKTNPKRALIYVVSKSGNTMETLAQFSWLYAWLEKSVGKDFAKNHLVFCTDPQKGGLRELVNAWQIPSFSIPPSIGGRFAALTSVGLFPALVAGIDCKQLLKGAADYRADFLQNVADGKVPQVLNLAHQLVKLAHNGHPMTVLMPYSQKLKSLTAWFTQLWAESLGKNGKGLTPIAAVGATDQHSILQLLRDGPADKTVGFVEVQGFSNMMDIRWTGPTIKAFDLVHGITMNQLMDAEFNATRQVLTGNSRPNFTIVLPRLNAHTMGQLLYMLQLLTSLTGYLLEIDPFDQPGVEEGKILTQERIIAAKRQMH